MQHWCNKHHKQVGQTTDKIHLQSSTAWTHRQAQVCLENGPLLWAAYVYVEIQLNKMYQYYVNHEIYWLLCKAVRINVTNQLRKFPLWASVRIHQVLRRYKDNAIFFSKNVLSFCNQCVKNFFLWYNVMLSSITKNEEYKEV